MPSLSVIVFYVFAAFLIISALYVVTTRNVFRAAIALTGSLATVACIFALLGADFLAASQLLVYVGGVMVIMLFVIMFSQQPLEMMRTQTNRNWIWALVFAVAIGARLLMSFHSGFEAILPSADMKPTSAEIGRLLLGKMIVPFEVVSLVLFAALVGAVVFAQDRKGAENQ